MEMGWNQGCGKIRYHFLHLPHYHCLQFLCCFHYYYPQLFHHLLLTVEGQESVLMHHNPLMDFQHLLGMVAETHNLNQSHILNLLKTIDFPNSHIL